MRRVVATAAARRPRLMCGNGWEEAVMAEGRVGSTRGHRSADHALQGRPRASTAPVCDRLVDYYIEEVRLRRPRPVRHHRRIAHAVAPGARRGHPRRWSSRRRGRVPVIARHGLELHQEAIDADPSGRGRRASTPLCRCAPTTTSPLRRVSSTISRPLPRPSDLPMILYNIPGRTGRNIEPRPIVRLWEEVPQVVGLKDCLRRSAPGHGDLPRRPTGRPSRSTRARTS